LQALAAVQALIGGAIAAGLLFAGLSFGAFAIGLVVMFALAVVTARRSEASGSVGIMMGYSFACAMFTWPVLLLVAGAVWGKWQ
jgi:Ca2+/H+ antiporter